MWWSVLPTAAIAVVVLVVPGLSVLLACRTHWATALAMSSPVSLAVMLVSTIAARVASTPWGVQWVLLTTAAAAALGAALLWLPQKARARGAWRLLAPRALAQYGLGQLVAVLIVLPTYLHTLNSPDSIAQRWDNVLHLNAIAAIVDTGRATPLDTGALTNSSYYPNAWHELGALVIELSGARLAPSVQASMLVATLVVWPLSMALLVEVLVRPGRLGRICMGALALGTVSFPLVLLGYGMIYPNVLGMAVVPALAALLLAPVRGFDDLRAPLATALRIVLVGIGAAAAHPGTALLGLIMAFPLLAVGLVSTFRTAARRRKAGLRARSTTWWTRPLFMVSSTAGTILLWAVLTPGLANANWVRFETTPQSIGEIITGGVLANDAIPLVAILLLVGFTAWIRRAGRGSAALVAMLPLAMIYNASAALEESAYRDALSGFLYRDSFRSAAALALGLVPIAVVGVDVVGRALVRSLDRARLSAALRHRRSGPSVLAVLVAALLIVGSVTDPSFVRRAEYAHQAYEWTDSAELLTPEELELIERLPRETPANAYVLVNPWEGGSLIYAFANREPSAMYMRMSFTEEQLAVHGELVDIASKPSVCAALPKGRPLYYLDLDDWTRVGRTDERDQGVFGRMEQIDSTTSGFEFVDGVGQNRLYRITACDDR